MASVEYNELKEMAKAINAACGTAIKIVGIKKDALLAEIKKAAEDGLDGMPEIVSKFYKKHFQEPSSDATCPESTKLGNTFDVLKCHADVLGVEVNEKLSLKGLENLLFETLDNLDQAEWDQLPLGTQEWDAYMGKKVKAMNKAAAAEPKAEDDSQEDNVKKPAPKKEPKVGKPRPDFSFTEGTNAHQIMSVFDELFKKSKGEGLKIKDIQDACEKAGVKSANVRTRVSGVLKYAQLPEGGEQVFKHKGLFYKKGSEVPEAE